MIRNSDPDGGVTIVQLFPPLGLSKLCPLYIDHATGVDVELMDLHCLQQVLGRPLHKSLLPVFSGGKLDHSRGTWKKHIVKLKANYCSESLAVTCPVSWEWTLVMIRG